MNKKILKWELIGILVISLLGSVLHFVFDWSGQLASVGAIAAVNESVWEHLKLAYWPTLVYAVVEYKFIRGSTSNFLFAKAVSIFIPPMVTSWWEARRASEPQARCTDTGWPDR